MSWIARLELECKQVLSLWVDLLSDPSESVPDSTSSMPAGTQASEPELG